MLTITIKGEEYYDEVAQEFNTQGDLVVNFEHSLFSLSKWESRFEKPFINTIEKTAEENLGYLEAMMLDPEIPPEVLLKLSEQNLKDIGTYTNAKMTATWFRDTQKGLTSREAITAELLYYWMFSCGIPIDCQHWHLNKLITLIRVFDAKNTKQKKMSPKDAAAERQALNAARRKASNSTG